MKITKLHVILFLIISIAPMMTNAQKLSTRPAKPCLNKPVTFEFTPSPVSSGLQSLNLILRTQLMAHPDTLAMNHSERLWTVTTILKDTSISILLFHLQGLDIQGRLYSMKDRNEPFVTLLYNINGAPVRDAYMSKALYLSGYGNIRNADLTKAIESIEHELNQYPDNFPARLLKYTLMMQEQGLTNEVVFFIREDIQKTLSREKDSEEALHFALQGYQMIDDDQAIRTIQEKLIRKNPGGRQAAAKEFNEIMSLDNAKEQALKLEKFIQKYSDSRLNEIALSQLASTVIELDDSTAMIDAGDRLTEQAKTMSGASGLSALAGVLAEKKWKLESAQRYIRRAMEIINQVNPDNPPPEISEEEWHERIQYTKARYQDITGWILFQKNEFKQALSVLEEASRGSMEPGILFHLAETLNAMGEQEQALSTYAQAAAYGGGIAEMAMQKLNKLWQTTGRDSTQLEVYLNSREDQVENEYIQKILRRRQIKKAPDFTLKRLSGGSVKLSDSRGQKVLLCFWATWSDASAQMMEAILEIASEREDLAIMAVAVDRDASDISRFVRDNRIPFQVLLTNRQTEMEYQLKGVPVLYVIDPDGRIHFQHKGFRPDLIEVLNIELDNLQ
ncbi:redoxin domain-containing protein [bacterium]|nr:redoxin domain-containing protein [bacterium]